MADLRELALRYNSYLNKIGMTAEKKLVSALSDDNYLLEELTSDQYFAVTRIVYDIASELSCKKVRKKREEIPTNLMSARLSTTEFSESTYDDLARFAKYWENFSREDQLKARQLSNNFLAECRADPQTNTYPQTQGEFTETMRSYISEDGTSLELESLKDAPFMYGLRSANYMNLCLHGLADLLQEADSKLTNVLLHSIHDGCIKNTKSGTKALGETLKQNKSLQSLGLTSIGLSNKAVLSIIQGLENHPTLINLSLEGNNSVGDTETLKFAKIINTIPNLQGLGLGYCGITEDDTFRVLATAIKSHPQLCRLSIASSRFKQLDGSSGMVIGFENGKEFTAINYDLETPRLLAESLKGKSNPPLIRLSMGSGWFEKLTIVERETNGKYRPGFPDFICVDNPYYEPATGQKHHRDIKIETPTTPSDTAIPDNAKELGTQEKTIGNPGQKRL